MEARLAGRVFLQAAVVVRTGDSLEQDDLQTGREPVFFFWGGLFLKITRERGKRDIQPVVDIHNQPA
jgi:hypothetical protein